MQEAFISNIIAGKVQYKAYKEAGYSQKQSDSAAMVSSTVLLRKPKIKARLNYRRAAIEAKTGITVANLQRDLYLLAKKAEEAGKHTAAATCYAHLLKTIGGFQADKQPDANLLGKALDAETARDVRKALEAVFANKYLALPPKPKPEVIDVEPT